MLQRRIVFGRGHQADSNTGRRRNKNRAILLSTDAMTLVGGEDTSAWRPLMWFWCSIATVAVLGGTVLTLLGPPDVPTARQRVMARLQADQAAAARAAAAAPKLASRRNAWTLAQPQTPPAEPTPFTPAPQPDQQSLVQAAPPLDIPAPGDAAQQDAPVQGRALVVLHPARPEDGAAIAGRLAARAGIAADQLDLGAAAGSRSEAAIRFYSESDHAMARRLGRELAGMGYTWRLENYSQRPGASKDQAIEVWLPSR